jgi:ABC-type dipeptide/oligopeptide/nickel transport system permease component
MSEDLGAEDALLGYSNCVTVLGGVRSIPCERLSFHRGSVPSKAVTYSLISAIGKNDKWQNAEAAFDRADAPAKSIIYVALPACVLALLSIWSIETRVRSRVAIE